MGSRFRKVHQTKDSFLKHKKFYRKESANKWYRNTVNNLISPNTISQNDEKLHTAALDDTAIPHVKIKVTEIPREKKLNTAIL